HTTILKGDDRVIRRAVAKLHARHAFTFEPRRVGLNQKSADSLVPQRPVTRSKNYRQIRDTAVRDPDFLPVEDVMIAVFSRRSFHACCVRSGIRFRQAVTTDPLTSG